MPVIGRPTLDDHCLYSVYFAPRGAARMMEMGMQISQRHLSPFDRLIGAVGEAGSGKSILLRGMFPGLELSNDDNGVNVRPLPILDIGGGGFYEPHTYHIDMRFEMAFTQTHVLAQAVREALRLGRRVVVEHFELLYPHIDMNAELLIGVGEDIIVTRPTIFGPEPRDLAEITHRSIRYRRMAHTAEDLAERYLWEPCHGEYEHSDVRHGFVLKFEQCPEVNLEQMEEWVLQQIARDLPVCYVDDGHIRFGEKLHRCTGPRMHVKSTGEIENFRMLHEYKFDPMDNKYLMVGLVGEPIADMRDLNKIT
ncbi:MAG: alanine-tRNA synthetase second additional domain-containing protein [Firmicutes bacterium]|nr:alanine-tRNA synthetase second additional domain-containing protein [Bacillota bacterium]